MVLEGRNLHTFARAVVVLIVIIFNLVNFYLFILRPLVSEVHAVFLKGLVAFGETVA